MKYRGLAIIAILVSLILGAYVAGYYTWAFYYAVNPLTTFEELEIPKTTGATIDIYCYAPNPDAQSIPQFIIDEANAEGITLPSGFEKITVVKKLHADKPIDVIFFVEEADIDDDCIHHYEYLWVWIVAYEQGDVDGDNVAGELVNWCFLELLSEQVKVDLDSSVKLPLSGDYDVVIWVVTWTKPVTTSVSGSFTIYIFAIQKL